MKKNKYLWKSKLFTSYIDNFFCEKLAFSEFVFFWSCLRPNVAAFIFSNLATLPFATRKAKIWECSFITNSNLCPKVIKDMGVSEHFKHMSSSLKELKIKNWTQNKVENCFVRKLFCSKIVLFELDFFWSRNVENKQLLLFSFY